MGPSDSASATAAKRFLRRANRRKPALALAVLVSATIAIAQGVQVTAALAADAPDEGRIAFHRNPEPELYEVATIGVGGGQVTRVGLGLWPQWSPDGRRLAFATPSADNDGLTIRIGDADGQNAQALTGDPPNKTQPAWSPDGTRIAFVATLTDEPEDAEVWVRNADGSGRPTRLTHNGVADFDPAWSPDGTRIVFQRYGRGEPDLWTMDPDGGTQRRLTSAGANHEPDWSPDGRRIAFWSTRHGDPEIFVMNADGSAQVRLTQDPAADQSPTWSPDGRFIALSRSGQIFLLSAEGGVAEPLPGGPTDAFGLDWRPHPPAARGATCRGKRTTRLKRPGSPQQP